MNHVVFDDKKESGVMVKVSTLDIEMEKEAPTLMKIDVEGYELPVLLGLDACWRIVRCRQSSSRQISHLATTVLGK